MLAACAAWVALLSAALSPPPVDTAEYVDLLLEQVRDVQDRDLASWRDYTFRRYVFREKLDDQGQVEWKQEMLFRITPLDEGFDEELILLDGETPRPRDVKHHRKKARFTKHFGSLALGDDRSNEAGYSLRDVLSHPEHRYEGTEMVNGILCHRLSFDAYPDPPGSGIATRLTASMKGTLWVTMDGLHLLRAEAESTRVVYAMLSTGALHSLKIVFENAPISEDTWLPHRIEVHSAGRIVFTGFRKHNVYIYDDYRPVHPPTSD